MFLKRRYLFIYVSVRGYSLAMKLFRNIYFLVRWLCMALLRGVTIYKELIEDIIPMTLLERDYFLTNGFMVKG